MSLSPRAAMARDRDGFPRKSSVTFGEVVSTFSKYGSVASRRHGGIYISKSLKIPNRFSTISDNTLKVEPQLRDSRESLGRQSPRSSGPMAPRLRSRTPSPCSRRPRSLPATPRSGAAPLRSSWDRDRRKEWPELNQRLNDVYGGGGAYFESAEAGGYARPETHLPAERVPAAAGPSRDYVLGSTAPGPSACSGSFSGGTVGYSGGGTGGSSGRHALKAKPSLTCLSCGNTVTPDAAYCRHCGAKRVSHQADCSPAFSPSSQALGPATVPAPPTLSRSFIPASSSISGMPRDGDELVERVTTADVGRTVGSPKANPRVASFVRLNGFLLRTHITSLLSALAEDGWLEAYEKERLCASARDAGSRWSQSFLQIYTRFIETDDVATFVAALKAQVA